MQKYLGLTLLPHSGVSLVFTGIAVSVLTNSDPESAKILQGTIAAAAVLNEIIAVFMAKKGFELAGEFNQLGKPVTQTSDQPLTVVIERKYGSGAQEIGKALALRLNLPYVDHISLKSRISPRSMQELETREEHQWLLEKHQSYREFMNGIGIDFPQDEMHYREQFELLTDLVDHQASVIVGGMASEILKENSNVMHVYITTDTETGKKKMKSEFSADSTKVLEMTDLLNRKLKDQYKKALGRDISDADQYDITINTGKIDKEEAVELCTKVYHALNKGE